MTKLEYFRKALAVKGLKPEDARAPHNLTHGQFDHCKWALAYANSQILNDKRVAELHANPLSPEEAEVWWEANMVVPK